MRLLEGLILTTLLLTLLANFLPRSKRPRWLSYLPGLAALSLLLHLVVEGYRWQMIPAYFLTAIAFFGSVLCILLRNVRHGETYSRRRKFLSIIGIALALLMLAIAVVLPVLFPIFNLPEPTGSYAVGTRYFYWDNEDRPDTYTSEPDDYREVSVQVWYPAELTGNTKPNRYMQKAAGRALAQSVGLPVPILDHFAQVPTHSYMDVGVAQTETPFPVITYSTSGLMSSHVALFEDLASHGYVVLCIGHPYWNPFVYDAGGEVLPFDGQNEQYKAWWVEEDTVKEAKRQITVAKTTEAQERSHQWHNVLKPVAISDIKKWAEDIGFVLDQVEKMNTGTEFLAGSVDLERVGIMGFSKGGAAAGQFCVTDERCKAGINLTGFMYGDIVDTNVVQPFMFVSEEELWCRDCYVNDLFYKRAESNAYQMKIRGARHSSFGDPSLWGGKIDILGEGATIEGERMAKIQNDYTLAFFDKHLKNLESPLLDGLSLDYPEVVFRSRQP